MGRPARNEQRAWRKRAIALEGKLSERERRYAVARAAGLGKQQAAIEAGYAPESAHTLAYKTECRARVSEYIELLKRGVITEAVLASPNCDALLRLNDEREAFEHAMRRLVMDLVMGDIDLANADPNELYSAQGNEMLVKNWEKLSPAQRKRVSGYKYQFSPGESSRTYLVLETHDSTKAKERLYAYAGQAAKALLTRMANVANDDGSAKKHTAVPSKTTDRGLAKATANEIKAKVLGIDTLPSDDEASALLAGADESSPAPSDEADDESDKNP